MGFPAELHLVREIDSTGKVIQEVAENASGSRPNKHSIDLGDPPHRSILGPTYAEAYSSFENGVSTYWTFVNAYPGRLNDNGTGIAQVQWFYNLHKDRPDATFVLDITGGRLQLVDYLAGTPLTALINLTAVVSAPSGEFDRFEGFARLDGHGGLPVSATFFPDWEGFDIASGDYTEQRLNDNIVGATLNIPAQQISLDLSHIFEGVDFSITVDLSVEARAVYPDGTAAMAYLRDPSTLSDPNSLLGGASITYSGLTLLPVPEPSTWALLCLGLAVLAWRGCSRHRARYRAFVQRIPIARER